MSYIAVPTDSILSNVYICKYKHDDKLTSQPHTDTCTSCSRQTTTFRHVNKVTCLHISAIPFNPSSSRLVHSDRSNNTGIHGKSMKKRGQYFGIQIMTAIEKKRCKFMHWPHSIQQPSFCILLQSFICSSWSLQINESHISNMTCQQTQNDSLITAVLLVYW
jgi:hypothetical protein